VSLVRVWYFDGHAAIVVIAEGESGGRKKYR